MRSSDGEDLPMTDLVKQRSMLMILIGACSTARTAFEAADNVVDAQLLADLDTMIGRSERELEKLSQQIESAS
jgi:hypothetical protein